MEVLKVAHRFDANAAPHESPDAQNYSQEGAKLDGISRFLETFHAGFKTISLPSLHATASTSSPVDDYTIRCDACGMDYTVLCNKHKMRFFQTPPSLYKQDGADSRARRVPYPFKLCSSGIPNAGQGIRCLTPIPMGTIIGPYEGCLKDGVAPPENGYCFKIRKSVYVKQDGYVDASDERFSNWLRFINCARYLAEQNCISFQLKGLIYYRIFRPVQAGEELLVLTPMSELLKSEKKDPAFLSKTRLASSAIQESVDDHITRLFLPESSHEALCDALYVLSSDPFGRGVYARGSFQPGDIVCAYKGQRISVCEGHERLSEERQAGQTGDYFVFDYAHGYCIDASIPPTGSVLFGRLVNHGVGRDANCELKSRLVCNEWIPLIVATTHIVANDQILYDYKESRHKAIEYNKFLDRKSKQVLPSQDGGKILSNANAGASQLVGIEPSNSMTPVKTAGVETSDDVRPQSRSVSSSPDGDEAALPWRKRARFKFALEAADIPKETVEPTGTSVLTEAVMNASCPLAPVTSNTSEFTGQTKTDGHLDLAKTAEFSPSNSPQKSSLADMVSFMIDSIGKNAPISASVSQAIAPDAVAVMNDGLSAQAFAMRNEEKLCALSTDVDPVLASLAPVTSRSSTPIPSSSLVVDAAPFCSPWKSTGQTAVFCEPAANLQPHTPPVSVSSTVPREIFKLLRETVKALVYETLEHMSPSQQEAATSLLLSDLADEEHLTELILLTCESLKGKRLVDEENSMPDFWRDPAAFVKRNRTEVVKGVIDVIYARLCAFQCFLCETCEAYFETSDALKKHVSICCSGSVANSGEQQQLSHLAQYSDFDLSGSVASGEIHPPPEFIDCVISLLRLVQATIISEEEAVVAVLRKCGVTSYDMLCYCHFLICSKDVLLRSEAEPGPLPYHSFVGTLFGCVCAPGHFVNPFEPVTPDAKLEPFRPGKVVFAPKGFTGPCWPATVRSDKDGRFCIRRGDVFIYYVELFDTNVCKWCDYVTPFRPDLFLSVQKKIAPSDIGAFDEAVKRGLQTICKAPTERVSDVGKEDSVMLAAPANVVEQNAEADVLDSESPAMEEEERNNFLGFDLEEESLLPETEEEPTSTDLPDDALPEDVEITATQVSRSSKFRREKPSALKVRIVGKKVGSKKGCAAKDTAKKVVKAQKSTGASTRSSQSSRKKATAEKRKVRNLDEYVPDNKIRGTSLSKIKKSIFQKIIPRNLQNGVLSVGRIVNPNGTISYFGHPPWVEKFKKGDMSFLDEDKEGRPSRIDEITKILRRE